MSATDADGDKLNFSATGADIVNNGDGSATVTYIAPNTGIDKQEVVKVTVSDGRKSVSKDVVINVKGTGVVENTPPTLTAPAIAEVKSGETLVISVSATDAEGDSLTYTTSQGTVTSTASGANISFTAPVVDADTTVNLVVTVSDGQAGSIAICRYYCKSWKRHPVILGILMLFIIQVIRLSITV